jgi:hypothetical protein
MGQARVTIHLIFSRARVEILKKLTKRGPCHVRSRLMQLSYHYQVVKEHSGFPKRFRARQPFPDSKSVARRSICRLLNDQDSGLA